jgi:hypothetical protein
VILQAIIRFVHGNLSAMIVADMYYSSLATPDSETLENNLVLVGHGIQANVQRMEEMKISKFWSFNQVFEEDG